MILGRRGRFRCTAAWRWKKCCPIGGAELRFCQFCASVRVTRMLTDHKKIRDDTRLLLWALLLSSC